VGLGWASRNGSEDLDAAVRMADPQQVATKGQAISQRERAA
jgi:hypothetical protein